MQFYGRLPPPLSLLWKCGFGPSGSDEAIVRGMMGRHGDRDKDDDRAPSDWKLDWDFEWNS